MGMRMFEVPILTDAGGDATVYTPAVEGYLHKLQVINTDLGAGADMIITDEFTGEVIYTQETTVASGVFNPRVPVHDTAQAAITGAYTELFVYKSRLKAVIDTGGNAKTGKLRFWISDTPTPVIA